MNFLLNLLWAIFGGGLLTAIEYLLAGLILCLSIVGIPFGLQCFKLAGLAIAPFGKVFEPHYPSPLGFIGNLLWMVFAGFWIFISHVALGLSLALTIIGIPFALQHLKLAVLALAPFDVKVRTDLSA